MIKEPRLRFHRGGTDRPGAGKADPPRGESSCPGRQGAGQDTQKKVRQTVTDPDTGKKTTKLTFEEQAKPPSKLSHAVRGAPANALLAGAHKEIRKSEQDNVGVEGAHKTEQAVEVSARLVREGYRSHKLKPYREAAKAEQKLEKANINALYQKSLAENPQLPAIPFPLAAKAGHQKGICRRQTRQSNGWAYGTGRRPYCQDRAQDRQGGKVRQRKSGTGRPVCHAAQEGIPDCAGAVSAGLPADEYPVLLLHAGPEHRLGGVRLHLSLQRRGYAGDRKRTMPQRRRNCKPNWTTWRACTPGYDEYRYNLDPIGHNPHELAAYLSALLHEHTPQSAAAQLQRVFDLQYVLTLTEEVEIRYRTETSTDPETGETTSEEVPYEYYILHVELVNTQIAALAPELLTPDEYEMYQVYIATRGNKPLLFGGGSPDMGNSEDLSGVEFINGTRPGNPGLGGSGEASGGKRGRLSVLELVRL